MPTDESGLVHHLGYADSLNVAISICLTYTLIFTCVRMHLRRSSFGADDVVVIVATIAAMVHFATSYACLTAGLGKPYDLIKDNMTQLSSTAIASAITFILALYIAKIAALVFLMRIRAKSRNPRLYVVLITFYIVLGIASAIIVTAGCPSASGYYWNLAGNRTSCSGEKVRWQVMTALDVISEAILLVLPIHLVWSLQMPQRRKLMIITTFWTRLPIIPLSIIRQTHTSRLTSASSTSNTTDISLSSTLVTILMAVELTYTLISCTLTTSKNFADGFSTGFGMGHMPGAADGYNLSAVGDGSSSARARYKGFGATTATGTRGSGHKVHVKTRSFEDEGGAEVQEEGEGPLRLRQAGEGRTVVAVSGGGGGHGYWGEGESVSSDGCHDDLGIVRHTEYIVSHDEAPILRQFSLER